MKRIFIKSLTKAVFAFLFFTSFAQNAGLKADAVFIQENLPVIESLSSRNAVFKKFQNDIQNANKAFFSGKKPVLTFYLYTCSKKDDLISISSRCCIPYDTIATANSIEASDENLAGKTLFLPTITGIFIKEKAKNRLELLLKSEYSAREEQNAQKVTIGTQDFYFYPNKRLTPSERAFFLSRGITLPIKESVISSSFGMRLSPISGDWKFHNGIDLASPLGTDVGACKAGIVQSVTYNDSVYGNYVVVEHSAVMTSLYAHLGSINVEKGQKLTAGEKIGEVGLTGLTTGPHLHFEIKSAGKAQDPKDYIKTTSKN